MLDSLVSAVSLFRLVRMLAAVVEDSCAVPYPDSTIFTAEPNGDTGAGGGARRRRNSSTHQCLRVHVHNYGMTVLFQRKSSGGSRKMANSRYCPVLHASLASSVAIARIEAVQQRRGAKLSISTAVHVGPVVIGTVGAVGQTWDAYGRGITDGASLAAASAAVVDPDSSSVAISRSAVQSCRAAPEDLVSCMQFCIGPRKSKRAGRRGAAPSPAKRSRSRHSNRMSSSDIPGLNSKQSSSAGGAQIGDYVAFPRPSQPPKLNS